MRRLRVIQPIQNIVLAPQFDLAPLREFVGEKLIPRENEFPQEQTLPKEFLTSLFDYGIFHSIVPKTYNGLELPVTDLVWITRALAYGSPSTAATFVGNLLGLSAIVLYAAPRLKSTLCASFMNEKTFWAFAMTEKSVGSDLLKTTTVAQRVANGFRLSGEKNYITNATIASRFAVFARVVGLRGEDEGITCFYVPGDAPGLTREASPSKIGLQKADNGTLKFHDLLIPDEHVLGGVGQGLRILTHCLNRSKTLVGAIGAGISNRAIDLVVDRLLTTERYQKPLLEQPAIRHELARMIVKAESAWLLTCQAATTWDAGLPAVREASMAKLHGAAMAHEIASQAIELFGARGIFEDHEISRLLGDAKTIEIVEGPTLVQELLIAKESLPRVARPETTSVFKLHKSELKKAA